MAEVHLRKINGALYPADDADRAIVEKYPVGDFLKAKITRPRNIKFHRKFFALIGIGFEAWEPPQAEWKGLVAQKNPERFRKDCIIQAGYYDVVSNLKGEVRAEAKSISFGEMDEDEFSKLYNAVANVILQSVLKNYTKDDLDRVVEEVCRF